MATREATNDPVRRVRRIGESAHDRVLLIAIYVVLALIGLAIVYPLIYILSASFSSANAVLAGQVWLWPVHATLDAYAGAFQYATVLPGFFYSAVYTVGGTVLALLLTVMMAYPLSRRDFVGRRFFIWAILFSMMFSGGLIPYYLVVKDLGMLNTIWSQFVPAGLNVFLVILTKSFFQQSIPQDLVDAAEIDGASDVIFLVRIVLPISKPILAVIALLTAVGIWNSYFGALIFLNSTSLYPITMVVRSILELGNITAAGFGFTNMTPQQLQYYHNLETLLQYSLIVVSTIPMVALYPFAQKYFVKGVMLGSLKD